MSNLRIELVSEYEEGLLGVPGRTPLLSWKVTGAETGEAQLSAELEAASTEDFADSLDTIEVAGANSQFTKAPGAELASREVRFYRVRIETSAGWSKWSNTYRLEAGLTKPTDFIGAVRFQRHRGPQLCFAKSLHSTSR